MFDKIIGALLGAWFLTWFGVEKIIIRAIHNIFNINMEIEDYYFCALVIGVITGLIYEIKNKEEDNKK